MFSGLVNEAKAAASGLVVKYVARASVVVPFAIALGFAVAATTVMLVQQFGHVTAYWIMAAGLAVIGLVAAFAVSKKEEQDEKAEELAEQKDTQEVMSDATAQALGQAPFALLGALASAGPSGVSALLPALRLLARNLPLVVLLLMIGALFWPSGDQPEQSAELEDADREEELDIGTAMPPAPDHAGSTSRDLAPSPGWPGGSA